MKTFFATILALVSFTFAMTSCSDGDVLVDEMSAQSKNYNEDSETRNGQEDAYVRIGMYANVEGYNIHVENMRVENCMASKSFPTFGQNITKAEALPTTAASAIYDNADGKYNATEANAEGGWIIVHFDAVLTGIGFDQQIRVNDVKYYITAEQAQWAEGGHYDYVISVDQDLLNLSAVDFDASVEDFQNGSDANTNC